MGRVVAVALLCLALLVASASLCAAGYANTVTVSAIGGDFTTVAAAVNSITNASATNRYLVQVYPGTYTGQVVCKPYVDIVGASRKSVVITGSGNGFVTNATLFVADHVYIANMTIKATAIGGVAIGSLNAVSSIVDNVYAEGDGMAAYVCGQEPVMDPFPDREANVDRWMTVRDCEFRGNEAIAHMSDNSLAENCIFTMISGSTPAWGGAMELGGNAILRDCLVNITLTGPVSGEFAGIFHTDYAYPTRLERTSISIRVLNQASTGMIIGLKNGQFNDPIAGRLDVDHCSIQMVNRGSGTTYDICNGFNQEGFEGDAVYVCATKYNADQTYGMVFPMSQGDLSVRNIDVTGNLNVTGTTTIVLPEKDRTRLLPIVLLGTINTAKKVFGDPFASPVEGYSFADNVTVKKMVVTVEVPGGLWPDSAGQIMLMKNGLQVGGAADFYNDTANAKIMKFETPINEPFTPADKMSLLLDPFYGYSDPSIMIEYTVD